MAFRVIIAGGRDFDDYELLEWYCDCVLRDIVDDVIIVSGLAGGADRLGVRYAKSRGYDVEGYPYKSEFGRSGGPIRNREMASVADALVLFWNGESRGSANMKVEAERKGLKIRVCKY